MQYRLLAATGQQLPAIGLGCMAMASGFAYGPSDESESLATLHLALELGSTFWDTADLYADGANERLLARVLATHRSQVFLATKFGFVADGQGGTVINGRPERVAIACEASLRRLGTDVLDLYYAHRLDPQVPVEETVGAMARLVEAGKVRYLGLSEVNVGSLRRAAATHPIAALQSEYSLFSREVEAQVLPACRELGITFVAYSPLGRGLLTEQVPVLAAADFRRTLPRFQAAAQTANHPLVQAVRELAQAKESTAAQVALGWLLAQGRDIIPIPGTKRRSYLRENVAATDLVLSAAEVQQLRDLTVNQPVTGARYGELDLSRVDQ